MQRIPDSPPPIASYTSETRPLWSVMIPIFNAANVLPYALKSVLAQALPENEMEIIVVDDASTDADIESIVSEIGRGRIQYVRQTENVGSVRNFETCINLSKGKLIHLLHADDVVLNGYYAEITGLFNAHPEIGAAFCRYEFIDHDGHTLLVQREEIPTAGILDDWLYKIAECNRIQYVAITVRREVYEELGSFFGLTYCEDWEMWTRISKQFAVAYSPKILAQYRTHAASISGSKFVSGQFVDDLLQAMQLIKAHIPKEKQLEVQRKSKRHYAVFICRVANNLWHDHASRGSVQKLIRRAFSLSRPSRLYWIAAKIQLKMLLNKR